MCNIAGYIGGERAAPILLDMLGRQEGWGGGFYTGIATCHNNQLHVRKIVGDVERLRHTTDALDLPGTIGVAHSRSPSGGGQEWAHPFVSPDRQQAYVANGSLGIFRNSDAGQRVARRLETAGYTFASTVSGKVGSYPQLADGRSIHFSDLMCGLIHAEIADAKCQMRGFARAYADFPGEIVGLVLRGDDPEAITVGRINMPMMLGTAPGVAYLATTAMAFPQHPPLQVSLLPASCVTRVTVESRHSIPILPPPAAVADLFPWDEAVTAVDAVLSDGAAHPFGDLSKATQPLWPQGAASQDAVMIYELLRAMIRHEKLQVEVKTVTGAAEGLTAPRFLVQRS